MVNPATGKNAIYSVLENVYEKMYSWKFKVTLQSPYGDYYVE